MKIPELITAARLGRHSFRRYTFEVRKESLMLRRFRLSLLPSPRHFLLLAVGILAMLLRIATVNAAIIVNDTWKDGTDDRSSVSCLLRIRSRLRCGRRFGERLVSRRRWNAGSSRRRRPRRAATSPPTGLRRVLDDVFHARSTPVTLANTGDSMKVTWVFTPSNVNAQ